MKPSVYVLGARGLLGKRLVALLREIPELRERVIPVGRKKGAIKVDVRAPGTLAPHLTPGDIVVDLVGPYRHDPSPLLEVCVSRQAHYIDLCESPHRQARVRQWVELQPKQPVKSCVLTGCSTIPALANALMPLLERPGVRVLQWHVFLSMGTRHPVSASLLYGLLRPLGRSRGGLQWWRESITRELGDGRWRRYGSYPASWPLERVRFWAGFDRAFYWYLLRVAAGLTAFMPDQLLWRLCQLGRPFASLFRLLGTERGSLRLELEDENSSIRALEVRASEHGLTIPVLPALWAIRALLERSMDSSREEPVGVLELSDLVSAKEAAANLQARGHVVQVRREVTF